MTELTEIRLHRNLRKVILQGHPWIYQDACVSKDLKKKTTSLARILDHKGLFLCWAMLCPRSPLRLRVLSTEKTPPKKEDFYSRLKECIQLRKRLVPKQTTGYRLINGEGDRLPGMICDIYDKIAVLQFDGPDPLNFWKSYRVPEWLLAETECESIVFKPRNNTADFPKFWGKSWDKSPVTILENNKAFIVDILHGQKTGFFIDQRANRQHLFQFSKGLECLNLFSYTGGFSIAAGLGGASHVTSVDSAPQALKLCQKNWEKNSLSINSHTATKADVFCLLQDLKTNQKQYDLIICDPPSLASSEKNKETAIHKYTEMFALTAQCLRSRGHLLVSSCSSHIDHDTFFQIIETSLSIAKKQASILYVGSQASDHPYPHVCRELRYLKFVHYHLS